MNDGRPPHGSARDDAATDVAATDVAAPARRAAPLRGLVPVSRDAVVRAYQRYAPVYDRVFGGVLDPGRRALAEAVAQVAPATLLEVGIGTGLMLARYPAATSVVGVDLSEPMLAKARARAHALPGRSIRLEVMDAEALTFPDGAFDCVTVPYVLSVTPNPRRLVAEIRRVCRKGGTILIVNHFSGSRFWWLLERAVRPLAGRVGFRSEFSLRAEISRYDWRVESVREVNLLGLSKLIAIRNVRS
ncbi:MAG TPA: methyltransferase domain-containing protein [Casimicrobiaceae bacterium]|nr:methyltransferase domain-containing protein [Casimicrobiaceae bacterium]